jgi:glyoxylase-like metal-dependent hydrolase (beta-lactamase superfamily II)
MGFFGKGEYKFPPIEKCFEERCIAIDEHNRNDIESILRGRIIETPGHTPYSISLLMNDGSLFCGDAAMNGFPSIHRTTIWIGDLQMYFGSWKVIIAANPTRILPGHGNPFPVSDLSRFLQEQQTKSFIHYHPN